MALDLYSLFSDDDDFVKETSKEKSGKKKTDEKKTEKKYELPMEIILDGRKHTLTSEDVGTDYATVMELLNAVEKRWKWYASDISRLVFDKDQQAYVSYMGTGAVKGTVTPKEGCIFYFGSVEIDIAGLLDEKKDAIEIDALQAEFQKEYPSYYQKNSKLWKQISILQSEKTGILVPVLPADSVESIPVSGVEKLSFLMPDHTVIEVGRERFMKVILERDKSTRENKSEVDESVCQLNLPLEETNENQPKPTPDCGKQELTISEISKLLKEEEVWLGDQMVLSKTGAALLYSVMQKTESANNKKSALPSTEKYPVKGTLLSVYYAQYELNPDLFDGKEEVERNDLLAFLVKQGHKEYEYTDVRIKYIKKEKMLLVTSKGSSKGAYDIRGIDEFFQRNNINQLEALNRNFCRQTVIGKSGDGYELVDTPMFTIALPKEIERYSYFSWKLPKIPWNIYNQGQYISQYVYNVYRTEACLDLYFCINNQSFFWNMPNQHAHAGSVITCTEPYLDSAALSGLIKVGQFHSHGAYQAFFSHTDNCDEIRPGIYGVWGDVQKDITFKMRAVAGVLQFLRLNRNLIFEEEDNQLQIPDTEKRNLNELVIRRMKTKLPLEELTFAELYLEDRKVLLLKELYLADIYCSCNLFVYDVYDDGIRPHIIKNEKSPFCILSDCELEPWILDCSRVRKGLKKTGENKSLIDYVNR